MRFVTVPVDDIHTLKIGTIDEFTARRDAINHKYKADPDCSCDICRPRTKVHKSACQLFGHEPLTMRSVLGIAA